MIYSNRTYSSSELKKLLRDSKPTTRVNTPMAVSIPLKKSVSLVNNQNIHSQTDIMMQTIRSHELSILQLKNELLKKDIEMKQKTHNIQQKSKQLTILRKQKEWHIKMKSKFDNQRQRLNQKLETLQQQNQQLTQRLQNYHPPKDRYQTCLRELDELKFNIESKQDVCKERDFYKYFYEEIRELIICNEYSAEEIRDNLRSLFLDINQRIKTVK